jgi:hypothetical protein
LTAEGSFVMTHLESARAYIALVGVLSDGGVPLGRALAVADTAAELDVLGADADATIRTPGCVREAQAEETRRQADAIGVEVNP